MILFSDRRAAGRELAGLLSGLVGKDCIVLALPRGGVRVVNEAEVARLGVTRERLARIERQELDKLARLQTLYRGDRPAASLAGRVVVLVDNGVATGATMKVAARAARIQNPARLIAAAPIGTGKAEAALRAEVDETVFATVPEIFVAVGPFYASFPQLNDEEVRALLDASRGAI
jgi:predicted phosphoribosyltransferase